MGRRDLSSGTGLISALAVGLCALVLAPTAGAYLYYGDVDEDGYHFIARANLDGGDPDPFFFSANGPVCGIAVDATRVYWATSTGGLWWVPLDGDPNGFVGVAGLQSPCGVATDGRYVYWAEQGGDSIGRVPVDLSGIDSDFITLDAGAAPCGLAVDSTHIYWGEDIGALGFAVKRAPLAGGPTETMTTAATGKCGVAVDANHVYWSNANLTGVGSPGTTIGRMDKVPGSGVDNSFVEAADNPCGVAVDATSVYWGNYGVGSIGRAGLDGSGAEQSLITGLPNHCGVAVDSGGPASTPGKLSLGNAKRNRRKGTATLNVRTSSAGKLVLSGSKVKRGRASTDDRFRAALPVRAAGGAKRKLARHGRVTVRVAVTFTPSVGSPATVREKVKLLKQR